jgi:two-component system chemotaxis response regulator CheB
MKPIRVLIVDDSPTMQSVLTGILTKNSDIEVVGTASDPFEAKDIIVKKSPDVITLDIEMPRMDGITFLKRLMSYRPIPVIMISSYTRKNSVRTLEALDAGAVDFIAKPTEDVTSSFQNLQHEITNKVRAAAGANIKPSPLFHKQKKSISPSKIIDKDKIIAIGSSTGGTKAIERILESMPDNINGIVIVQHMVSKFTKTFAERLDSLFDMNIKEAKDYDRLFTGEVLLAPGGYHLLVKKDYRGYYVRVQDSPPVKFQRPSVDVLFHSVAESTGGNAIGILLTGMGGDGADGLMALRKKGALTIAQDEATSVIFGMPKVAIEIGAAEVVASLDDIADIVLSKLTS